MSVSSPSLPSSSPALTISPPLPPDLPVDEETAPKADHAAVSLIASLPACPDELAARRRALASKAAPKKSAPKKSAAKRLCLSPPGFKSQKSAAPKKLTTNVDYYCYLGIATNARIHLEQIKDVCGLEKIGFSHWNILCTIMHTGIQTVSLEKLIDIEKQAVTYVRQFL